MTVRGYQLAVDWSRQGTYAGTLEDVTSYVQDDPDLTVSYGRDQTTATTDAGAGKLAFGLNNMDRQFSPENTASPIANRVLPGTPTRLQKTHDGTIHTLFAGVLDDLDADPNSPAKTFTGEALDAWGRPGAEQLSTAVYSGLRTGDAINVILDLIGWTGPRDIDPGATLISYWWEEATDAATAVQRLVDSEGPPAIAYVEGGTFVFRGRHHRLTRPASQTSQGTFTHIHPEGSGPPGDFKILKGTFTYNHGLRHIVNAVTFEVSQRVPGPLTQVWSTDTPITLAAGQTLPIEVRGENPFIGALVPVDGVDYELQFGSVTVALARTSGVSTTLFIQAGGTAAMLNRLALRATPLTVAHTVKVTEEDDSSIGTFGRATWPSQVPWANAYDARAIAQRIVAVYASARPVVTFQIAGTSDDYLEQILTRRISDRVTVRNDPLGINRDFIIERITHTIRKLGLIHRVEFGCEVVEPSQPANVFTFDVAGKGFNDGAFGVSGIDNPTTMFTFDVVGKGFNQGVFAS